MSVSMSYPMLTTTFSEKGMDATGGDKYSGGTKISDDGSFPMRVIFRCLARKDKRLWMDKDKEQYQYKPEDLYISHIIFYAVAPSLIHKHQYGWTTTSSTLRSYKFAASAFQPSSLPELSRTCGWLKGTWKLPKVQTTM